MPYKNRVVATGLGVLAANGTDLENFWSSLVKGRSGIGPITLFDASDLKSRIAGEVKGFDPMDHLGFRPKSNRMARHTQLALAATIMALKDAEFDPKKENLSTPIPVIIGASSSAFDVIQHGNDLIREKGLSYNTPFIASSSSPQAIASTISEHLGVNTQVLAISTACAAGTDAIGSAVEMIRNGRADIAIAGGTDAPIIRSFFSSFVAAGLASTQNNEPHKASRPFDLDRDAGVISEGSGIVILENLEHALARGATPYLEITGYGTSMDPAIDKPASGFECSMKLAIANAGKSIQDIDYICAHGPSHPILDAVETEMIKKVFGKQAYFIPVSSIKGVIGNPFAAAGPIQLIACSLAIKHNMIPPTANYEKPDPLCDLDYVPSYSRIANIECALMNVHGIGGANSTLIVEKLEV